MNVIGYISVFSIVISCSFISEAQNRSKVDLKSDDLIKPNQRTIYTGTDNHLRIVSEDGNTTYYKAVSDKCEIVSEGEKLTIRTDNIGYVIIYIINVTTSDTLRNIAYICEPPPLPSPLVADKPGGDITFKELFNAGSVSMTNKTDLKELPAYKITGFIVGIYTGMGLEYYQSTSDRFTPEQLSAFMKMKTGSKFLIKDIMVKNEDAEVFNLGTINFKLKKSN